MHTESKTCPKCGEEMDFNPADTLGDGQKEPAQWRCNNGHYVEVDGPDLDSDNDERWLERHREEPERFDECTGQMD